MESAKSDKAPFPITHCLRCDGSGFLACGRCHGDGLLRRPPRSGAKRGPARAERESAPGPTDGAAPLDLDLRECPECYSGEIRCTLCSGSGRLPLVVVCAWRATPDCPGVLRGPELTTIPDDYPVSHGVCDACARLEMAA